MGGNIGECKDNNFPVVLCGNKSDLEEKREIKKEEGEQLAKKYNISFFETSNKLDINVQQAGLQLINKIIQIKKKKNDNIAGDFIIINDCNCDKDPN